MMTIMLTVGICGEAVRARVECCSVRDKETIIKSAVGLFRIRSDSLSEFVDQLREAYLCMIPLREQCASKIVEAVAEAILRLLMPHPEMFEEAVRAFISSGSESEVEEVIITSPFISSIATFGGKETLESVIRVALKPRD